MQYTWIDAIDKALLAKHIVLTPNRRLANTLNHGYFQHKAQDVQRAPNIYTLEDWLDQCWLDLLACRYSELGCFRVLHTHEEYALWVQIISEADTNTIWPHMLAKHVQSAEQILQYYQIEPSHSTVVDIFSKKDHIKDFMKWRTHFYERATKQKWITRAMRDKHISVAFQRGELKPAEGISCVEFVDINPLYTQILNDASKQLKHIELAADVQHLPSVRNFADSEEEICAAALWARDLAHTHKDARIGIAVNNLGQQQTMVERICQEVISPERILPEHAADNKAYQIQLGTNLTEIAAIQDALRLLELCSGTISREDIHALLDSPFLWQPPFPRYNFLLEKRLSQRCAQRLSLADLAELAEQCKATALHETLSSIATTDISSTNTQSALTTHWCTCFSSVLSKCGWMGARIANHHEHQHVQEWHKVLKAFSGSAEIYGLMSAPSALAHLRNLLENKAWTQDNQDASITVMSISDAAWMRLDYLWIAGINADRWPNLIAPNPIIPLSIQQQHKIANADYAHNMEQYKASSAQLLRVAPNIVLSCPQYANGIELGALSPLFSDMVADNASSEQITALNPSKLWHTHIQENAHKTGALKQLANQAVKVSEDEEKERTLATNDIQLQSACAFKAFAKKRLEAYQTIDYRLPYIVPWERGNIIHSCMKVLWGDIKDSKTLQAMPAEKLDALIAQALDKTLTKHKEDGKKNANPIPDNMWEIECANLKPLLRRWFEKEKEHVQHTSIQFRVVMREQSIEYQIGSVRLNMRIDRVDAMQANNAFEQDITDIRILDYKTGSKSFGPTSIAGERPREPQLLMYALACHDKETKRVKDIGWALIDNKAINDPNYKKSLVSALKKQEATDAIDKEIAAWHETIDNLVAEYIDGDALINPNSGACANCNYRLLCRIDETH